MQILTRRRWLYIANVAPAMIFGKLHMITAFEGVSAVNLAENIVMSDD